jgi:hypothetical protein
MSSITNKLNAHYEELKNNMKKIIDNDEKINIKFKGDSDILEIYDENGSFIFKAKYAIAGYYNIISGTWTWSWAIDNVNRNLTTKIEGIKNLHDIIRKEYSMSSDDIEQIYFYLSTNSFLTTLDSMNYIMRLILYLTSGIWMFQLKHFAKDEKIYKHVGTEYIMVDKILQYS